ncbi:MAG TPA: hypothetical protein VHF25_03790 [Nitriliruptorales bacterium]|nr:hypothetical protein [Nitriliruptorales bacterium]
MRGSEGDHRGNAIEPHVDVGSQPPERQDDDNLVRLRGEVSAAPDVETLPSGHPLAVLRRR